MSSIKPTNQAHGGEHSHDHPHPHPHPHPHEQEHEEESPLVTLGRREPAGAARGDYWRSLSELRGGEAFQERLNREFPEPPADADPQEGVSRRNFMQLMGASAALAGVAGCRYPEDKILPFADRPDGRDPGVPEHYATSMNLGGHSFGIVVTAYDGRPIKVEGNQLHPASLGAANSYAQGSVLELYDPERSEQVIERSGTGAQPRSWLEFETAFQAQLAKLPGGAGFSVLTAASNSTTMAALRTELLRRYPAAKWYEYEPVTTDNEREGLRLAFGKPYRAQYDMDRVKILVALDDDIFAVHPMGFAYARKIMVRRRPEDGDIPRLYAVESRYTVYGCSVDNRLPLRSELVAPFLLALEAKLGGGSAPGAAFLQDPMVARHLEAMASDLAAARGAGLVTAGFGQPPEVHAIVARVNAALGNAGQTVRYTADPDPTRPHHMQAIRALATDMAAGGVNTLLMLGGNPVYDAPADVKFAEALAKVEHSVHLGRYLDETSRRTRWHLPMAHFLEAWGDGRAWDGTITLEQPLIDPLKHGRSPIEVLALAAGRGLMSGKTLVREAFDAVAPGGGGELAWRRALHDGVVAGSAFTTETPAVQTIQAPALTPAQLGGVAPQNGQLELLFYPSPTLYDGRFANNGWLQETPDYATKIVWDNAVLMGISTARAVGLDVEEFIKMTGRETTPNIKVTVGGASMELPVYLMPGMAPGSLAISLGYGRTAAGFLGGLEDDDDAIPVGFDAYKLRMTGASWIASGVNVGPADSSYRLVTTQDQYLIDAIGMQGRAQRLEELVREDTLAVYQKQPDFAKGRGLHSPPIENLWPNVMDYSKGHKWGMAIDLQTCIGCEACVVACTAENNVLIVGKDEVMRGRLMHWLRVDRYFKGNDDDATLAHQPMPCQQCENAPCESVCPVGATSHSEEGLNDMAYNRCIGTRYCGNNCPYKVRRFNYKNWAKEHYENIHESPNALKKLRFNPEVTVRFRGVMEKCTYCVQRIKAATIPAENEGRRVRDGEIVTACAQTCPTDSIIFGDLNDPESRVSKFHAQARSYPLLAWLNTRPRTWYLAAVKNPHPSLAEYAPGHGAAPAAGH